MMNFRVGDGNPLLPGAVPVPGGVNYTARVPIGAKAELVLLDAAGAEVFSVDLEGRRRAGESVSVRVLGPGVRRLGYCYRVDGRLRRDIYAKRLIGDTAFAEEVFDDGGKPLDLPLEELIIYRLHVRGFTKDPKSGVREKGTFRGLMRKIPYIKEMGFTAVELMPAYEWDDALREPPVLPNGVLPEPPMKEEKRNYWGYAKKNNYFAPKQAFAYTKNAVSEVKELIRALHDNGLCCIMEFYAPPGTDPAFLGGALRHWRIFYHVDGFHLVGEGVPAELVLADPVLADAKLFLSGIDTNLYRPYRSAAVFRTDWMYSMRGFLKGDAGRFHDVMRGLTANGYSVGTVNFMAATDGFTLRDLVSYNDKHNEANGENNYDGASVNVSWNCGEEGPTKDPEIRRLRLKQMKNALALVFFSQGIPMICAGDEFGNSQQGNNNAYAMDNPAGWVNWGEARRFSEFQEYVRKLIEIRKMYPVLHLPKVLRASDYKGYGLPDVSFHDTHVWYAPFEEECRSVGMLLAGAYARREDGERSEDVFVGLNAHWEEHIFEIPEPGFGREWVRLLDTDPEGAAGLFEEDEDGAVLDQRHLPVPPRAAALLVTRRCSEEKARARKAALEARQEAERRKVLERIERGRQLEATAKARAYREALEKAEQARRAAEEAARELRRLQEKAKSAAADPSAEDSDGLPEARESLSEAWESMAEAQQSLSEARESMNEAQESPAETEE